MDDFKPVGGGPWTATVMVSGENHQVAIERLRDLLVVIDMAVDTQTINPTDPTTESRAVISTPNSRFDESPHFWCPSKGPPMALHSVLLHLRDRLCNVNRPGGRKIRTYVDRIRTYVRKIHLRYKALRDPRISTADMLSPLLRFGEREMIAGKRVLITGGVGFLGTHLCPAIKDRAPYDVDLPQKRYRGFIDPQRTKSHFESAKLEIVIHLAVRARGIGDNRSSPSRFFYENAIMGINVMEEARRAHVEKLAL